MKDIRKMRAPLTLMDVIAMIVAFRLIASMAYGASVIGDETFDTSVPSRTFNSPFVAFDASHHNTHSIQNTFKPFADILENDGYILTSWNMELEKIESFQIPVKIFVTCNALGTPDEKIKKEPPYEQAFTREECVFLERWVMNGGSLLVITDHAPWSYTMSNLLNQFSVIGSGAGVTGATQSQITFNQDHICDTNLFAEIKTVKTFGGQALSGPAHSIKTLLFPQGCKLESTPIPVLGNVQFDSQGVLIECGSGRVAIFGEAAMFSAQTVDTMPNKKMGMNIGGNDNKEFLLALFHWLSHLTK